MASRVWTAAAVDLRSTYRVVSAAGKAPYKTKASIARGTVTFRVSGLPAEAKVSGATFTCLPASNQPGECYIGGAQAQIGSTYTCQVPASKIGNGRTVALALSYTTTSERWTTGVHAPGQEYTDVCHFTGCKLTVSYAETGGTPPPTPSGGLAYALGPDRETTIVHYYPADATDFARNGDVILQPTEATVTETDNGQFAAEIVLPKLSDGKWRQVARDGILRLPCPRRKALEMVEKVTPGTGTYALYTASAERGWSYLRSRPSTDKDKSQIQCVVKNGEKLAKISGPDGGWYRMTAEKTGTTGYIPAAEVTAAGDGSTVTVESTPVLKARDQLFRVTEVEDVIGEGPGRVTVKARHIFYDLSDAVVVSGGKMTKTAADAAFAQLLSGLDHAVPYSIYTDCTGTVEGDFTGKTAAEALLDPETGMAAQLGAHVMRDNFDVYVIRDIGVNRGVRVEHARNLTGATLTESTEGMANRIVAQMDGQVTVHDYAGRKDTERIIAASRAYQKKDGTAAEQAKKEFDAGLAAESFTLDVTFALLADTAAYGAYAGLQALYLGDDLTVSLPRGVFGAEMTEYTWNCVTLKYDAVRVGATTVMERRNSTAGYQVSGVRTGKLIGQVMGDQIGDDAVTARTIQAGAVTAGKIAANAVTAGTIDAGAVTTDALAAGSVTAEKLAAGAITADTIEAGSITTDKLAAGAVTAEKIESKSITAEQLQAGLITADSGLIADSAIDTAQIADGSITDAKIVDLTANKITGGTIDAGKVNVKNLNADNITVGTINGARIPVLGEDKIEDGAISGVKIVDGAVTTGKIEDSAVTADKIVAGAVTAEKIAAEAVTANKILAGAVTAGKIAAGAVTADAIAAGAIQTNHISAAAQEALVLEAVSSVNVGGRNLMKNSDFAQGRLVAWGACPTVQKTGSDDLPRNFVDLTYNAWSLYQDVMLKANTRYTLSMDARLGAGTGESPVTVKLDTSNIQLTTQNVVGGYFKNGKRVYVSFTYGATSQTERIYLRSVTVEGRSIQVANIKLEEGNRPTDWTPAPEDPASGVQTSSVVVSAEGVDIASTGHFRTNADTDIQMTSGDGQNSYIRFGGAAADEATFIADKNGVQAPSGEFKTLKAAGNDVWSTGNLVVSTTKPAGHGILWIKPSATSTVNASRAASGETLDGGVERKIYLDRQGSDALTGTSFTYKVTAEFEEIKERRSGVKLQCILAGNGQKVTMTYTYTDSYWLVWQHKQITFEATSAVNIFGGTGNIAVTFKALTLTPDTVSSGSFRLMPGTTITASGTSDSASGTEMACTMTWIP